jgi:hypothetical protein
MQTIKEVKEWFADNFAESSDKYEEAFNNYLSELDSCDPEGEEENLSWETWYIRWYEVALKEILSDLTNPDFFSELKTNQCIENYINKILEN